MVSLAGEAVIRLPAMVAAVANLGRAHLPAGLHQGQRHIAQQFAAHHVIVRDQRTEPDVTVFLPDRIEAGYAGDVHQHLDVGALAALQLNEHVGAARDDAGPLAMLRQQGQRFIEAAYAVISLPHARRPILFACLRWLRSIAKSAVCVAPPAADG